MAEDLRREVWQASRMIRFGAAALVQLASEDEPMRLYGPGFEVVVTRTDPAAWYPGKPESDRHD